MPARNRFPTVAYLLKRAQQATRAAFDEALRAHGISASQYAVMRRLEDEDELSGAELARRCFVTAQAMQELLVGLEAAGFVARTADPSHGRVRRARLTARGRRLLAECRPTAAAVEARLLAPLSPPERTAFAGYLRRCAEALEADDEPGRAAAGRSRGARP